MATEHQKRIFEELKKVGVSNFGLKKFTIRYLPEVIHKNEHIKGIVYGRIVEQGKATFIEGVLVATDRRVIFIDHRPGYTNMDEFTYDVVAGIKFTTALFSGVTLHTRLGDFTVRFAPSKCARIFVKYVESRRLESEPNS